MFSRGLNVLKKFQAGEEEKSVEGRQNVSRVGHLVHGALTFFLLF